MNILWKYVVQSQSAQLAIEADRVALSHGITNSWLRARWVLLADYLIVMMSDINLKRYSMKTVP